MAHVSKSAITGKFVSNATVKRHPKTTVVQMVCKNKGKSK